MALFSFSTANDDEGINEQILRAYAFFLANKAGSTILKDLLRWKVSCHTGVGKNCSQ